MHKGNRKREQFYKKDKNAADLWGCLWASVLHRSRGPNVHPLWVRNQTPCY